MGAACGNVVTIAPPGGGGAPPMDASAEPAPDAGDAGDEGEAGVAACDDLTLCSRFDAYTGCIGPTQVGDFCDELGTPCSATPPDCAKLESILGAPATLASCGDGLSFCSVDLVIPSVDAAVLAQLCQARAAVMQPVDCMMD